MATNFVLPAVLSASSAAPAPRLPQPTSAIFSKSLPAAWALLSIGSAPTSDAPIRAEELVRRNWRRETGPGDSTMVEFIKVKFGIYFDLKLCSRDWWYLARVIFKVVIIFTEPIQKWRWSPSFSLQLL